MFGFKVNVVGWLLGSGTDKGLRERLGLLKERSYKF